MVNLSRTGSLMLQGNFSDIQEVAGFSEAMWLLKKGKEIFFK